MHSRVRDSLGPSAARSGASRFDRPYPGRDVAEWTDIGADPTPDPPQANEW